MNFDMREKEDMNQNNLNTMIIWSRENCLGNEIYMITDMTVLLTTAFIMTLTNILSIK
jgi:hypothetical protein